MPREGGGSLDHHGGGSLIHQGAGSIAGPVVLPEQHGGDVGEVGKGGRCRMGRAKVAESLAVKDHAKQKGRVRCPINRHETTSDHLKGRVMVPFIRQEMI